MASLTEVVDDYLKRLKQCEHSGVWMQMKMKGMLRSPGESVPDGEVNGRSGMQAVD